MTTHRRTPTTGTALVLILLLAIVSVILPSRMASALPGTATLLPNERLAPGQRLVSEKNGHTLTMQTDGNLVLTSPSRGLIWTTWTQGNKDAYLAMQGDGNLVVYSKNNVALWNAGKHGNPGASLTLDDDGNLVLSNANNRPIWWAGTVVTKSTLSGGDRLRPGGRLVSEKNGYILTMQTDGNLVLTAPSRGVIWASWTQGNSDAYLAMQGDGNLVVYSKAGVALWNAGKHGNPGASLSLQNDGNLVLSNSARKAIWSTGVPTATASGGQVNVPGIGLTSASWAPQVRNMLAAASRDGIHLTGSSFRSSQSQIELRKKNCGTTNYAIYQMPSSQCRPPTAIPGASMHEQGLAIDFKNCSTRSTACYQWLAKNASKYGIRNLPSEPWHWSINGR